MIGFAMLYAIAVGLPILFVAVLFSAVLRRQGRAERAIWLVALGLALVLPVVALATSSEDVPAGPLPVVETGLIGLPTVVAVPAVPTVRVPVAQSAFGQDQMVLALDDVLTGLWLLASLVLVVRWAVATFRLARRTRSCPSATVDGVRVSLTRDLGPAVSGVIWPRILVPSWLLSMPQQQRSLVLAHEEEHVRARDPLLIIVSRIARTLAPWNPLVWLLSSRLQRAVELDCDRRVLRRHPDVEAYGTTLLTVSSRDRRGALGAAAFAESEAPLRRRILAMTTPPRTVSILGVLTSLVLGILLTVGVFAIPIPAFRMEIGPESPGVGAVDAERIDAEEMLDGVQRLIQEEDVHELDARELYAAYQERVGERAIQEMVARREATFAEQQAGERKILSLEERVALLEASQLELTDRAEVAESLVQELSERLRVEPPPPHGRPGSSDGWDPTVTGTITAVVTDEGSDRPLRGAQVFLRGTGLGGLSNDDGRILLLRVPAGEYQVVAHLIGFGDGEHTVTVVENEAAALEFRLREQAIPIQPVVVTDPRADEGRPATSDVTPPLIFVDGTPVSGSESATAYLHGLEGIDRIEVIKGRAAVERYGEGASGGVIQVSLKHDSAEPARPIRPAVPGRPFFTPFSVAPTVLNLEEVEGAVVGAYPSELRAEGIGGTVDVYLFVDERGSVQQVQISKSSGHEALDRAALAVADVLEFSPALNRDRPLAVWVEFPITFLQTR